MDCVLQDFWGLLIRWRLLPYLLILLLHILQNWLLCKCRIKCTRSIHRACQTIILLLGTQLIFYFIELSDLLVYDLYFLRSRLHNRPSDLLFRSRLVLQFLLELYLVDLLLRLAILGGILLRKLNAREPQLIYLRFIQKLSWILEFACFDRLSRLAYLLRIVFQFKFIELRLLSVPIVLPQGVLSWTRWHSLHGLRNNKEIDLLIGQTIVLVSLLLHHVLRPTQFVCKLLGRLGLRFARFELWLGLI